VLFYLAQPAVLVGIILALIIGVFAHDSAQVLAARLARDPTPLRGGALTRSIRQRLSPFSAVAMLIAGDGWVEPIRMNDVWRRRRFHVTAAILAGPLAYLILAFLALLGYKASIHSLVINDGSRLVEVRDDGGFLAVMAGSLAVTFASMFILSLIPVPPTDGGRILFLLGPQSQGWKNAQYNLIEKNYGVLILLLIVLLPVLFTGFPSVIGQLLPPLLRGLGSIIGL
jgi:Zn-dependent protease